MIPPSLSRLERERIAAGVKAQADGASVRWWAKECKCKYFVNGREHPVFTAPNARIFRALRAQAERLWKTEIESASKRTTAEAPL